MEMNIPKLRGKMAEKGFNITTLSREIGVNRNTLSEYFDHPDRVPYKVIVKLSKLLCDNKDEVVAIFFANNLRKM